MINIKIDGHVHTRLCHHARGEMEDYVQAAVDLGLEKIFFLEHMEAGIIYPESTWLSEEDFNYYFREGERLREKYKGRLDIGLGVEVGYNPARLPEISEFLSRYTWDRIGISYHFYEVNGRHYNMVSSQKSNLDILTGIGVNRVLNDYFRTLREAVDSLPGNVLCHLDAVLRHYGDVDFNDEHMALITELLDAVARRGMALEINTSGYKYRGGPYPAPDIVRQALKRHIPLLPGSDAHRPEEIGRNFDLLPVFCGFE